MAFADLKNDFVFRRLFATHSDILRGLEGTATREGRKVLQEFGVLERQKPAVAW
ncbi:MAG: hypothetical protein QM820_20530 [Minicystis sp.]